MSTIPAGLRADYMRARMEDKATIQHTGGLYMGSTQAVTYRDINNGTATVVNAYATKELEPGTAGMPLISNGPGNELSYGPLTSSGIANNTITLNQLGNGTIGTNSGSNARYIFNISEDPDDDEVLVIEFYPESNA